jgi:hypothetical protein
MTTRLTNCKACGRPFRSMRRRRYCSLECRRAKAPAVYRFVCPDGRSYVGSRRDIRHRRNEGVTDQNRRLAAALNQYSSDSWTYEVLEALPAGCSDKMRLAAEQRHIDRLRSWSPEAGFNAFPAVWDGDGPAQRAARQWSAAKLKAAL